MTEPAPIDLGGVLLRRAVPCSMSDGVVLYSDHYAPTGAGRLPTILMRQPYGRDIASTVVYAHPAWFARHGYNVVIQDVRGRGDSGGEFYPFLNESKDGAETIAWLRTLPESNGRIGMYGFSYQGMTQLLAASAQPEGLLCIAPAMAAHDLYHGWFYNNGALRLASSLGWGLQMLKEDARRLGLHSASAVVERAWSNLPFQFAETPYASHPAINASGLSTYVSDWLQHDEPGEFWSRMDISTTLERIDIPALHVSGWYDSYLKGTVDGFLALTQHAGSAFACENQYLVAGPWVHIPWGSRIGAQDFGAAALLDTDRLLLRWFNHWLKGTDEFAAEPKIRHFALNSNAWHSASEWPSEPALLLHLHSDGNASSSKGDGKLSEVLPGTSVSCDIFNVDPEVPVIAPGGLKSANGCFNQAAIEQGNNILIYTSAACEAPLHIFGTPRVTFYAATSADHADLVAKLVCVRPNGDADFICIGVARSNFLFREKYIADAVHTWRFDLEPTSWVLAAGERLRLEIAGNSFPLYDRNPHTCVKPSQASPWSWKRSTHVLYHDAARPSALHLPLCEAG